MQGACSSRSRSRAPTPAEARASRPTGLLRILYLGRLYEEQKRVRRFPIIFDQLRASGIAFHWTIAGEGPEKALLQSTMRVTSPKQTVSFPGKISYQDVPRILSEHDIFVLASDYEGLPLSLLEAMGQGLVPVVSNSPSGIPEVVDETTGKLVAPDNVAGYAEAIIWLQQHPDRMARLSQNARDRVRRDFSVSAMTEAFARWVAREPRIGGIIYTESARKVAYFVEKAQCVAAITQPRSRRTATRRLSLLRKKRCRYSRGFGLPAR